MTEAECIQCVCVCVCERERLHVCAHPMLLKECAHSGCAPYIYIRIIICQ